MIRSSKHSIRLIFLAFVWLGLPHRTVQADMKNPWGERSFADVIKDSESCATTTSSSSTSSSSPTDNKETKGPPDTIQKGTSPPNYTKLPRGAKPYRVHHVYDGDTLTLKNGKRVRLLGIDTPETKTQGPTVCQGSQGLCATLLSGPCGDFLEI
mmetsp:Transcript_1205/g.2370  ORF Transcript_1205/g.2370 Transcript_1205/m.2370 type:complete len:154 (-) Transcript_1205:650-1111(-)